MKCVFVGGEHATFYFVHIGLNCIMDRIASSQKVLHKFVFSSRSNAQNVVDLKNLVDWRSKCESYLQLKLGRHSVHRLRCQ
jgi:hypothetical protein